MNRKLIKLGAGYVATIPIKWVRKNNLSGNDEININENNNSLIINNLKNKKEEKKEFEINLKKTSNFYIKVLLNTLYRNGYHKINISIDSIESKNFIKQLVKELLGFEVTYERENNLILENVAEPIDDKNDVILRRIFHIIKDSFEIIKEDFNKKSFKSKEFIENNRKNVNSYTHFSRRNIAKNNKDINSFNYWELNYVLVLINQSIGNLYIFLESIPNLNERIIELFNKIIKNYDLIINSFYKKENNKIIEAIDDLKELLHNKIINEKNDFSVIYYLGELSRLIYLTTPPLVSIMTKL